MTLVDREKKFEALVRWYPKSWRMENGAAVIGTLMDQADAEGLSEPTWSQRLSFAGRGLLARFVGRGPSGSFAIVDLAVASAFALFYAAVVS